MSNSIGCGIISEPLDLFHLQLEIGVDLVVGEHAALLQEGAVLVELLAWPRAESRTRSASSLSSLGGRS